MPPAPPQLPRKENTRNLTHDTSCSRPTARALPRPGCPRRYNAYSYLGSDLPETVPSGRSQNNVFSQNVFRGARETIKIKEADGTQFLDNVFEASADANASSVSIPVVRFDNATMNLMQGNAGLDPYADEDEEGAFELKADNDACFDGESDAGYEPVC